MFNFTRLAIGLCAMASLTACVHAPLPTPQNFPVTTQMKVRAAAHWQVIAKDVVGKTTMALAKANKTGPVFVAHTKNPSSSFDHAFHNFLITELVAAGIKVQTQPRGALTVTYDAQVVRHNSPRPGYKPGEMTRLAAGLYVLGNLAADSVFGATIAGAGALLGLEYLASEDAGRPGTELVLTTTIADNEQFITRNTDVYYIEWQDGSLFQQPAHRKQMNVVGQ